MHVMTAHMAHRHGVSFSIGRCDLAGIGKAGILGDRQRIHVGAKHDRWPFAVAEQPNHTGLAHTGRYLKTGFPEPVGGDVRRSRLVHRQFGIGVNVLIKGLKIG